MKTAHDVKLLNGSKQEVSYTGVETVTMPGTDGQDKVFTAGTPIDAMDISPDFSEGNMPLEAPGGYVVRSATIKKPEGAEQVIAKGETLAGIAGAYVTPGTAKEIEPDFSEGDQTVTAEGDDRWNEVVVKKPEGLVPENIPEGIEIAGVKGTQRPITFVGPEEYLNSTITSFDADVTLIGASAFSGCASLLTVSIPECKVIENSAFWYCEKLKSVYAPKCEFLGSSAFGGCKSLTSLSLPLVTTIRNDVFASQMSDITVGCLYDSKYGTYYTEIGGFLPNYLKAAQIKQVFDGSVVGANNFYVMRPLSSYGYASFAFSNGSYSQINLTFPYSDLDTSVPYMAFYNCPKLSEVRIRGAIQNKSFPTLYWSSSGYRDMGSAAFQNCSQIGTLKLLFRDTMRFGQTVFSNCSKLSRVYLIPSTLKSSSAITAVPSNIFYNTPMSKSTYLGYYGSIYAPSSIVEILKTRTGWSLYAARMVSLTDDETAALIEELDY